MMQDEIPQFVNVRIEPIKYTVHDQQKVKIIELEAKLENAEDMLKSYDSDVVTFRDLIHNLYAVHKMKSEQYTLVGEFARALQNSASAAAYLAALNHFDEIRKIR